MSRKKNTPKEWAQEFQAFISADAANPPRHLTGQIVSKIKAELNPSHWLVFSKMSLVHFVVGTSMLFVCPQFDVALFDGMGLMALFMRFGETVCTILCGAVFLGASALVASLVLTPEEVRKMRKTTSAQLVALSLLSVGVFISVGATVVAGLGAAWILGAIVGGLASFEFGWLVRSYFRRRLVHGI